MKRLLLVLFLISSFVTIAQAQSCDEALAYYVSSTPNGSGEQWVAQTECSGKSEVLPLIEALREQNVGEFNWSEASESVAYGFGTIYVMSAADPTPRPVIEETETIFYHSPVWSPDGTQLVVVATDEENATDSLVVTNINGEARQIAQITANPEQEALIVPIRWSPDGGWISYARSHTTDNLNWETDIELLSTDCIEDPAAACEKHTLAITDDSGERPDVEGEGGTLAPEPWWGMTWSPDGEQLAFLCYIRAICFLNADGSDFRQVDIAVDAHSLAWSASGDYLAYQAEGEIYVYDIEQDTHTNITETPERLEFVPTWIPLPEGEFLLDRAAS